MNQKTPTLIEIFDKVCNHYEVDEKEIKGLSRKRYIVDARQVFFYLSRTLTKNSSARIAMFMNRKDHGTVLHAEKKIKGFMEIYPEFKNEINNFFSHENK